MTIQYLTSTKKWLDQNKKLAIGLKEADISALEQEYNVTLPKAYKEFLYLGGKCFLPIIAINYELNWLKERILPNEKAWLSEFNIDLKRPYWVFGDDEGAIIFFYLDEGDNPPVHVCEMEEKGHIDNWLRKVSKSFSEYIDFWIEHYKEFGGG